MATIDKTKKYFFHNVYGEAQTLIDSLPADTIAIPAGWSAAAETNRDDYVDSIKTFNDNTNALHVGPTDYPTVLYHRETWNQSYTTDVDGTETTYNKARPAGCYQYNIFLLDKSDWTWTKINANIQTLIDNNTS